MPKQIYINYLGIFADKHSNNILFVDFETNDNLNQEQLDNLAMDEFKDYYPELVSNYRLVETQVK
jgi:hypothetical protein